MLNILSLMVLLSAPADAHHKAHKAPPPKHKHHATAHRHTPPRHRHHARRVVGWNWTPGHYDPYGHWIRGRWSFGVKVVI